MFFEHCGIVHFVNMVAGKYYDIFGVITLDKAEVLINGVCGAFIPVAAGVALVRRKNKCAAAHAVKVPGLSVSDILGKFERLILGKDAYGVNAGVNSVGKGKSDDSVFSAERNRRFGKVFGEGIKSAALAAGQKHC